MPIRNHLCREVLSVCNESDAFVVRAGLEPAKWGYWPISVIIPLRVSRSASNFDT
jgi:hypothetical protein